MTGLSVLVLPGEASLFEATMASLVAQSGVLKVVEVIVPADGRYAVGDLRAVGVSVTGYNEPVAALAEGRGEWGAVVRPGDTWSSDRLANLSSHLTGADVIYGDAYLSWAGRRTTRRWSEMVAIPEPDRLLPAVIERDCLPISSLLIRRGCLQGLDGDMLSGVRWDLDMILQLLEREARFERYLSGLPTIEIPSKDNEGRLEYLIGTAAALRRCVDRGPLEYDFTTSRLAQAVVETQIFSRYQKVPLRSRLAPLHMPEVRSSKASVVAQSVAALAPWIFRRIHKSLAAIRPLGSSTLDLLGRQPLHVCASAAGSVCNTTPLVSVVIPCYNYGEFLSAAIDSALAQTYPNIEVIVIDDGSTDDSAAVARAYGDSIKLHLQDNIGLSATRNRAVGLAEGSFITFLDADNALHPLFVSELLGAFCDAAQEHGVDGGSYRIRFAYCQIQIIGRERHYSAFPSFNRRRLGMGNYVEACSLISADALTTNSYSSELPAWEDWDFYLSLLDRGFDGKLVDLPLLLYRRHHTITSMADAVSAKHRQKELRRIIWARHPARIPTPYRQVLRLVRQTARIGLVAVGRSK